MRDRLLVGLLLALLLAGCGVTATPTAPPVPSAPAATTTLAPSATSAAPSPAPAAGFADAACAFDKPLGVEVRCGYLRVPADRSRPEGASLRLHVAIFSSTSTSPAPDPIVYLEGGPGGNALEAVPLTFQRYFAPFLDTRDLIIFDQRGTGYSEPALDCPEVTRLIEETLATPLSAQESYERVSAALLQCHDRLIAAGVDLDAYDSAANAADLADLRTALGYDQWNLLGLSYGTRLALTAMRDHPEGLRSVILDSSYPLQVNLYADFSANMNRAFEVLFAGCAGDAACSQAYPDLRAVFYRLVERLNAQPVSLPVANPLDGTQHTLSLYGDLLISTLGLSLYSTELITLLPKAIYSAYQDQDYALLAMFAFQGVVTDRFVSRAMQMSVQCNEEVPFLTREQAARAAEPYPQLRGVFDQQFMLTLCARWQVEPNGVLENEPVRSAIPTLVLAGEYDPITPPAYGDLVAQTLSHSYQLTFPGLGHGVSISHTCPRDIAKAFLDDPASRPDVGCMRAMSSPTFVTPVQAIKLAPFKQERFGIAGVVPEGWPELSPGIYAQSAAGTTVLGQQAMPGGAAEALALLTQQLALSQPPATAGEHVGKRLRWKLYTLAHPAGSGDLALAEQDGKTYLVLLISSRSEREQLYQQAFIPALDELAPLE